MKMEYEKRYKLLLDDVKKIAITMKKDIYNGKIPPTILKYYSALHSSLLKAEHVDLTTGKITVNLTNEDDF